jgi:hypothetical protein
MGRPRTPVAILEPRGSFDTHPERRRVDPETTGELGQAPDHMSQDRAAICYELASILPVGVARNADRFAVELLCDLMFKFRTDALKGADLSQLVSLLGRQINILFAHTSSRLISRDKMQVVCLVHRSTEHSCHAENRPLSYISSSQITVIRGFPKIEANEYAAVTLKNSDLVCTNESFNTTSARSISSRISLVIFKVRV